MWPARWAAAAGAITYSTSSTGVCSVDPNAGSVSFTGAGPCVIDASAAANGDYAASTTDATLTITVSLGAQTVSFSNGTRRGGGDRLGDLARHHLCGQRGGQRRRA